MYCGRLKKAVPYLIVVVLLVVGLAQGKVIYVDDDAPLPGDGTKWATAYTYLQDALMVAQAGDEIRVAQGIYTPSDFVLSARPNMGRAETFQLKNGVAVQGGYAGIVEADPNARDSELYQSILNGDINQDDVDVNDASELEGEPSRADNCYHVVTGSSTDDTAVLDGFTITGGNANGALLSDTHPHAERLQMGGGMYNYEGSPTLKGCIFSGNSATEGGGGIYSNQSNSNFTNCAFSENFAEPMCGGGACFGGYGAGMYNDHSSLTLTNCTFSGNRGGDGFSGCGGMHNNGGRHILTNCTFSANSGYGMSDNGCSSTLTGCTFTDNHVLGMINMGSSPTLTNCTFSRNRCGGLDSYESSPTLTDCTFSGNLNGGMLNVDSHSTLNNCTFSGNSGGHGGGMSNYGGKVILNNCMFRDNSAGGVGGGLYNVESDPTVNNCTFTSNSAKRGGGMFNGAGSSPTVADCIFSSNSATEGGGMYDDESSSILTNCIFTNNLATYGGAMYAYVRSSPTLTNCTFAQNSSENGNAVACDHYGPNNARNNVTLINCILWDGGDEIWNNDGSTIEITYSNIEGGYTGIGNIDTPPLFADVDTGDYHLKSQGGRYDPATQSWTYDEVTSPCIDAGDPMAPIGTEPFPNGGIVNMGAYGGMAEASKSYFGRPPCETIVAGDVNGDCIIDFRDFWIMGLHWCEDNNP